MPSCRYHWKTDLWTVHLELENSSDRMEEVSLQYEGSDVSETLAAPARETLRHNICRYDGKNQSLHVSFPESITVRLYENLDRAFYTDIPSPDLEVLSE